MTNGDGLFAAIPAKAEILKAYIILHLEPILSNTHPTALNILRFGFVYVKLNMAVSLNVLFLNIRYLAVVNDSILAEENQSRNITAIFNLTYWPSYAILLSDYPPDNLISYSGGDSL